MKNRDLKSDDEFAQDYENGYLENSTAVDLIENIRMQYQKMVIAKLANHYSRYAEASVEDLRSLALRAPEMSAERQSIYEAIAEWEYFQRVYDELDFA